MSTVADVLTAEVRLVLLDRLGKAMARDHILRLFDLTLELRDADHVHALHVEVATHGRLHLKLGESLSLSLDEGLDRVDVDLDLP